VVVLFFIGWKSVLVCHTDDLLCDGRVEAT